MPALPKNRQRTTPTPLPTARGPSYPGSRAGTGEAMTTIREAAHSYLERGWSVIPVRAREKRPIIAWQRYQQQPPTAAQVDVWFTRWPSANVGVVTGAVSGLVVVDIDPNHGGTESLAALEHEHGHLPATVEAISGGGGRHLYFSHPGETVHNRAGIKPGVDLRGDGGLIVAPPSVHPSGNLYQWTAGHAPDQIALAPLPDAFLPRPGHRAGHPTAYWRALLKEGVTEGSRNATIASLTGHLLWHGLDSEVVTEMLLCWNRVRCRPPLGDDEVVRTVASINRSQRRQAEESS